jgi:hypothetical protein
MQAAPAPTAPAPVAAAAPAPTTVADDLSLGPDASQADLEDYYREGPYKANAGEDLSDEIATLSDEGDDWSKQEIKNILKVADDATIQQALDHLKAIDKLEKFDAQALKLITAEAKRRSKGGKVLAQSVTPAAPRSAGVSEIMRYLDDEDTPILTAQKGQDTSRNQELLDELASMGYKPIPVAGHYDDSGIVEQSYIIPGLDREDAMSLGSKYQQESILMTKEGLVFTDRANYGKVLPRAGEVSLNGPEEMYYSEVTLPSGEVVKFSIPLGGPSAAPMEPGDITRLTARASGPAFTGTGPGAAADVTLSAPREAAAVDEVIQQVAGEVGRTADDVARVTETVETILKDNPSYAPLLAYGKPRQHLEAMLAETDPAQIRRHQYLMAEALNLQNRAFSVQNPILSKLAGIDPRRQKTMPGAIGRSSFGSDVPDDMVERVQAAVNDPAVQKELAKYEALEDKVRTIAAGVGKPLDDFSTRRDVMTMLGMVSDPAEKQAIKDYLKTATLGDNGTIRELWSKQVADQWYKEQAKKYGFSPDNRPPGKFMQLLQDLRGAWVDQALVSVRYHTANMLDMTVKTALEGYGQTMLDDVAAGAQRKLGIANPVIGKSAWEVARRTGARPPQSVINNRGIAEIGSGSTTSSDLFLSSGERSRMGKVLDRLPIPGAVADAGDTIVSRNRDLAHWVESGYRVWAWAGELQKQLKAAKPMLIEEARRSLDKKTGDIVAKRLQALGVDFSAEDVRGIVSAAKGSPESATSLGAFWQRAVHGASREGEAAAQRVHFNHLDERVIEEKLHIRSWAPFYFWASRNLPYFAETMAQHPWTLRLWAKYDTAADEAKEEAGLTNRFGDKVPMPFLRDLFGPGIVWANPMVTMSIADQLKDTGDDPDAPPMGEALRQLRKVGLSPAPWVDIPLVALGAYGPEDEPFNALRHTGPVSAALSAATGQPIDLEGPIKGAVRKVQGTAPPQTERTFAGLPFGGSAFIDRAIEKKLAEMSLERTGRAGHPVFMLAAANPNDPLYKEALRDVLNMNLVTQTYGFTSPFPATYLPDAEAEIRGRSADVRAATAGLTREQMKPVNAALAQAGDPATAYWNVTSDPRLAQINAGFDALERTSSGSAMARANRQIVLRQYPLLAAYLDWQKTLPPDEDRSPAAFVKTLSR